MAGEICFDNKGRWLLDDDGAIVVNHPQGDPCKCGAPIGCASLSVQDTLVNIFRYEVNWTGGGPAIQEATSTILTELTLYRFQGCTGTPQALGPANRPAFDIGASHPCGGSYVDGAHNLCYNLGAGFQPTLGQGVNWIPAPITDGPNGPVATAYISVFDAPFCYDPNNPHPNAPGAPPPTGFVRSAVFPNCAPQGDERWSYHVMTGVMRLEVFLPGLTAADLQPTVAANGFAFDRVRNTVPSQARFSFTGGYTVNTIDYAIRNCGGGGQSHEIFDLYVNGYEHLVDDNRQQFGGRVIFSGTVTLRNDTYDVCLPGVTVQTYEASLPTIAIEVF